MHVYNNDIILYVRLDSIVVIPIILNIPACKYYNNSCWQSPLLYYLPSNLNI